MAKLRPLTTGAVSRRTGLTIPTLHLWIQTGRLSAFRLAPGCRWQIPASEVERIAGLAQGVGEQATTRAEPRRNYAKVAKGTKNTKNWRV